MATTVDSAKRFSMLQNLKQNCSHAMVKASDLTQINITRWTLVGLCACTGASIALLSGKAFDALQSPPEQATQGAAVAAEPLALERLRNSRLFEGPARKVPAAKAASVPARASTWQLQGVFTGSDKTSGSAILSDRKQPARLLRTQQKLSDGTILLEVHSDRVVLQQTDGRLQIVRFPAPSMTAQSQFVAARTTNTVRTERVPNTQQRSPGALDSAEQRRLMVRKRLETLRQRAGQRT